MATTTNLSTLKINYLTQAQFDNLSEKNANELYLTPDAGAVTSVAIDGGGAIDISGSPITSSGTITISHADTSNQSSSSNSGRTYIQSITLDGYGHVTGLNTGTETVTDTHYTTHLYVGLSNSTSNAATTAAQDTYLRLFDNTTARESHKLLGSNGLTITSDSSGHITFNSPSAFTAVEAVNIGTSSSPEYVLRFTKSGGGTTDVSTENIAVVQSEGANRLVSTAKPNGIDVTGPVKFVSGVPVQMDAANGDTIPWGLITGAPSSYTPSSHVHGNITNGGDITSTVTIASGDRLVINDESESKINNSSITFGTSTTTFLSNKGTWETPAGTTYTFDGTYNASTNKAATVSTVTNAIAALDVSAQAGAQSKTITSISETDGKISVTYSNISITTSQISDFPSEMTPAAHTHSLSIAKDTSTTTTNVTLDHGTKYKLTAGGSTYLFTTPSDTDSKVDVTLGTTTKAYLLGTSATPTSTATGTTAIADTAVYLGTGAGTLFATKFNNLTLTANTTGFSIAGGSSTSKTLTVSESYTLGAACAKSVVTSVDTSASLPTSNAVKTFVEGKGYVTSSGVTSIATSSPITGGTITSTGTISHATSGVGNTITTAGFYKFKYDTYGHVTGVSSVAAADITGLLSFNTAYNSSSNKIATMTDLSNAVSGLSGNYVTINTDQTITASQKTFNGATRWSVSGSATGSKYGACQYNSSIDALVFSFGTI